MDIRFVNALFLGQKAYRNPYFLRGRAEKWVPVRLAPIDPFSTRNLFSSVQGMSISLYVH